MEDTMFGAYELPVFQKSFQGLAESAAEAASSGCPDYEVQKFSPLKPMQAKQEIDFDILFNQSKSS